MRVAQQVKLGQVKAGTTVKLTEFLVDMTPEAARPRYTAEQLSNMGRAKLFHALSAGAGGKPEGGGG